MEPRNSRMPRPIERPSSGRRFGPKMISTMMRTIAISSGPMFGTPQMVTAGAGCVGRAVEVEVVAAGGGLGLALVLGAGGRIAVWVFDRPVHSHEGDLADRHPVIEGDRQRRQVRELQGQVALEAGIHEARGAVD